jgi:hypothetical protein
MPLMGQAGVADLLVFAPRCCREIGNLEGNGIAVNAIVIVTPFGLDLAIASLGQKPGDPSALFFAALELAALDTRLHRNGVVQNHALIAGLQQTAVGLDVFRGIEIVDLPDFVGLMIFEFLAVPDPVD